METLEGLDTIKFNKFNVPNKVTKEKTRVWYSLDNHVSKKPSICIYAKDYSGSLAFLSFITEVKNDTDSMTDYFDKDRIWIHEGNKYYAEIRKQIEALKSR